MAELVSAAEQWVASPLLQAQHTHRKAQGCTEDSNRQRQALAETDAGRGGQFAEGCFPTRPSFPAICLKLPYCVVSVHRHTGPLVLLVAWILAVGSRVIS